ncbi:unnamed protein product [Symbiodinium sp. CCMP2456]|nr:unnamed protein product [Symbiodinium sp. CCMP2456]
MDVKSWLGFWHWAHNGCKPNGSITLKEEEDGQRILHTTFSSGVGTWWPHDQQASSIELEWQSKGGSLVRHTLKAKPSQIGGIGAGHSQFRVVACHRPSCSTFGVREADGKDGDLSWVPDSRTIRTCGWRKRLGTSAAALRVSSKLTSAKKYLSHEDPPSSGVFDSLCPNCRRPLNIALGCGELLTVTSPLTEAKRYECKEEAEGYCSPCPTCRRPILISKVSAPLPGQVPFFHRPSVGTWLQPCPGRALASKRSRCAYATLLYGTSVEYVRDARVLGFSLRQSGTPHDLVLLHTSDVPEEYLEILGRLWILRPVDRIDAASTLFTPHSRFRGVFTKLHAWGLIEYDRVILLDLDLLVQENVDSLFELQPPAAMWAAGGQVHGRHIVAPHPFKGYHKVEPWGKAGCVNAGVILLEPNLQDFGHMKQEVECREHPEHIVTTSPEQDYLTRFFWHTPHWTHIDVSYNFQLHHLALRLPDSQKECERRQLRFEDIRIVHFSAHPKPSQREPDVSVEAFVEQAMANYEGVQIYVRHDPEAIERRNRSGKFPKLELRSWGSGSETGTRLFEESRALGEESQSGSAELKEVTASPAEFQRVREVCLRSFQAWSEAEKQCKERFGSPDLLESFPAKLGSQLQGTCVEWDRARGIGWIRPDDGSKLIFVHFNGLVESRGVGRAGRAQLEEGQLVSFSVGEDDKGRRTAVDVKASVAQIDARPLAEEGREEGSQQALEERVRGNCTAWYAQKKFGFVSYVDGCQEKKVFLHQKDLLVDAKDSKGASALKVGQTVQFTPAKEEKAPEKLRALFATCTEDDDELVCEVQAFAASDALTKSFPPGTPWQRRLLHQVARALGFFTRSEGEEPHRSVCISRAEEPSPSDSQQKVLRLQARIEEVAEMPGQSGWHLLLGDLTGHEWEQLNDFCKLRGLLLCRREAQNAKQCQHFVCKEPAAAVLFT